MQQAGLTLDTANPRPDLLEGIIRVSDKVRGLRIVLDHVPSMLNQLQGRAKTGAEASLRELAKRPTV
jgi:predicted TIM-barrel fold metal-dependent hydrolase